MIRTEEIRKISNSFYNEGLRLAQIRDLTGAVGMLKTCLNLNKYHTEARNLLGLICMEMGETAEALRHWVISTNFQDRNNRASYYLERAQKNQDVLDELDADIRRYNSALQQAQNGNPDLAAVQLSSVVDKRDDFVKAQNLMALLCIQKGEYAKAGRYLLRTLRQPVYRQPAYGRAGRYGLLVQSEHPPLYRVPQPPGGPQDLCPPGTYAPSGGGHLCDHRDRDRA